MDCIILAAGRSERMGANKMLLPLRDKTVIEHCISVYYKYCSRIYAVVGHRKDEILPVLRRYDKVVPVENADYRSGMFSSVRIGIRHIRSPFFFLTPGDMPFVQPQTVDALAAGSALLSLPEYRGVCGHPIMLSRSLIPHILASEHGSLSECLSEIPKRIVGVADEGIITDIDTAEDYHRFKEWDYNDNYHNRAR
jgi:molybdenum cofactor cytidylyltransferase